MRTKIEPGRYVVAVSGGVDSMVLLDLLAKQVTGDRLQVTEDRLNNNLQPLTSNLKLVVAHFNHGIRADAAEDEKLVKATAEQLGLPFEVSYGRLGKGASEAAARAARYGFLDNVRQKHDAKAIITAHHQDDLIETAFINLLRGTGRRGLAAIMLSSNVIRPLLDYPKSELIKYAKDHQLRWREDPTNQDEVYLRNYLRRKILPKLTPAQRRRLVADIKKSARIEREADSLFAQLSSAVAGDDSIDRGRFTALPADLGNELIAYWLRLYKVPQFDKKTIMRLNTALRTSRAGTWQPVKQSLRLEIGRRTAHFAEI